MQHHLIKRSQPKNNLEILNFQNPSASERDLQALNLKIRWRIQLKNKLKNIARSSLSALTHLNLTMPMACVRTVTMRGAAPS